MSGEGIFPTLLWRFGPLQITDTVIYTWIVMGLVLLAGLAVRRRLRMDPAPWQTALEGIVETIDRAISAVLPQRPAGLTPLIGSLWIYLVLANLLGVVPGMHSPTRDLSATTALAALVFTSVHWFGIRSEGLAAYLRHYLAPNPILLPFHVIGEITRTVALAVRLFGNMMSLEMTALLILAVAGLLAPVPILMLHIVEALVQAYIFGMLALIYIAGGIQSQQTTRQQ